MSQEAELALDVEEPGLVLKGALSSTGPRPWNRHRGFVLQPSPGRPLLQWGPRGCLAGQDVSLQAGRLAPESLPVSRSALPLPRSPGPGPCLSDTWPVGPTTPGQVRFTRMGHCTEPAGRTGLEAAQDTLSGVGAPVSLFHSSCVYQYFLIVLQDAICTLQYSRVETLAGLTPRLPSVCCPPIPVLSILLR